MQPKLKETRKEKWRVQVGRWFQNSEVLLGGVRAGPVVRPETPPTNYEDFGVSGGYVANDAAGPNPP